MKRTPNSAPSSSAPERVPLPRTSEILCGILTKNPGVKRFTVQRILASIGEERIEASLMMFSIPAILPVPGPSVSVAVPTGAIGYQMLAGKKQIRLPRFMLRKTVSRRALAVAIHAIVPILEAAEKLVRPRWSWVNDANVRRAIGLFVFLLAIAIAYPLFGFNSLHATSIFVMALGMAEQDGLAVLVGVGVGLVSLALLVASGTSSRAVRSSAGRWLRKLAKRLGLKAFVSYLERSGYDRLARVLRLKLSDLLLLWDPEKKKRRAPSTVVANRDPKSLSVGVMHTAGAHRVAKRTHSTPTNGAGLNGAGLNGAATNGDGRHD